MFELWFGPQLAPYAVPFFVALPGSGMVTAMARSPHANGGSPSFLQPARTGRSGAADFRNSPGAINEFPQLMDR